MTLVAAETVHVGMELLDTAANDSCCSVLDLSNEGDSDVGQVVGATALDTGRSVNKS